MDAVWIVKCETIPRTPDGVRILSRPAIPTEPGRPNGLRFTVSRKNENGYTSYITSYEA